MPLIDLRPPQMPPEPAQYQTSIAACHLLAHRALQLVSRRPEDPRWPWRRTTLRQVISCLEQLATDLAAEAIAQEIEIRSRSSGADGALPGGVSS